MASETVDTQVAGMDAAAAAQRRRYHQATETEDKGVRKDVKSEAFFQSDLADWRPS